jgi:hypothetical protein
MRIKNFIKLVAVGLVAFVGSVNASVLSYDITVTGGWFDCCGNPFNTAFSPTLSGQITVDNSLTNLSAITSFSLATGTKTWTLADFVGAGSQSVTFDGLGNLVDFSLDRFVDLNGEMYIYLSNTFGVSETESENGFIFNACNGCVSITPTSSVPEPSSFILAFLGLLGLVVSRRSK